MFVLMATVLTFLTSPILSVLYPKIDQSSEPEDGETSLEHHNASFEGDHVKVDLPDRSMKKINRARRKDSSSFPIHQSTMSHRSSPKPHRRRMTLF